MEVENLTT